MLFFRPFATAYVAVITVKSIHSAILRFKPCF